MTNEEFLKEFKRRTEMMFDVAKTKNSDYAGVKGGEDPFANFRIVEHAGIASVETGFLTRMMDKMSRISTFVERGTLNVKDESVEDTLTDLSNYSLLMAIYVKDKRDNAKGFSEAVNETA